MTRPLSALLALALSACGGTVDTDAPPCPDPQEACPVTHLEAHRAACVGYLQSHDAFARVCQEGTPGGRLCTPLHVLDNVKNVYLSVPGVYCCLPEETDAGQ